MGGDAHDSNRTVIIAEAARKHSRTLQMGEENIQKMSMTRRVTKVVEWAIKNIKREMNEALAPGANPKNRNQTKPIHQIEDTTTTGFHISCGIVNEKYG